MAPEVPCFFSLRRLITCWKMLPKEGNFLLRTLISLRTVHAVARLVARKKKWSSNFRVRGNGLKIGVIFLHFFWFACGIRVFVQISHVCLVREENALVVCHIHAILMFFVFPRKKCRAAKFQTPCLLVSFLHQPVYFLISHWSKLFDSQVIPTQSSSSFTSSFKSLHRNK